MQAQQEQRDLRDKSNNVTAPRATTAAWQGQRHQRNGTKTPGQLGQQHRCNDGDDAHEMWGQRGQRNKDNDAGAMRATTLMQSWQWCQHNEGNDAIMTTAKMPVHWQWQWHHCVKGNNTSLKRAAKPLQQEQQQYCNNGKDAWTAKTPAHWQQQHHRNEGNNPSSMTVKMPAHWWWQQPHCYKGNDASSMIMVAWLQQRCHCNKGNICHNNDGKNACASTATMPLQRGQQRHCDDGEDTCALMMTKMPLQQGWWHQFEDGNNAIAKRETMPSRIMGKDAIVTRALTPAWWQKGLLRINNGNDAIIMRATIAIAMTAMTPVHWRWWHHHDKSNDTSLMTSNEGDDASLTTAEIPAHRQQQWRHHDKSNNRHCNNSKDDYASTATMPSWQGQWRQLYNKQWEQQC
jgi:hypothetical protein